MRMITGTVFLTTTMILLASSCLQADDNIPQLAMPVPPGTLANEVAVSPIPIKPEPIRPAPTASPLASRNPSTELKLPGESGGTLDPAIVIPETPVPAPANTPTSSPAEVPQLAPPVLSIAEPPKKEEKVTGVEEPKNTDTPKIKAKKSSKKSVKSSKHSKHKKGKKKGKAKDKPLPPISYIIKDRLPEEIYKKSYDKNNKHLPVAYYEKEYNTLLFTAIRNDDINGLRSLLNTGRDINMMNENGDTPLLAAVKNNSINAVDLLIKRHANRAIEDKQGLSPQQIAEQNGEQHIIEALNSY